MQLSLASHTRRCTCVLLLPAFPASKKGPSTQSRKQIDQCRPWENRKRPSSLQSTMSRFPCILPRQSCDHLRCKARRRELFTFQISSMRAPKRCYCRFEPTAQECAAIASHNSSSHTILILIRLQKVQSAPKTKWTQLRNRRLQSCRGTKCAVAYVFYSGVFPLQSAVTPIAARLSRSNRGRLCAEQGHDPRASAVLDPRSMPSRAEDYW